MQTRIVRALTRIGFAGAAVLALTGCPEDASQITEIQATSLDFDVAPLGAVRFTTGDLSIDRFLLVAFDPTVTDAFSRGVAGNGPFYSDTGTDFGPGWNFDGFDRNSTLDARTPALTENDASISAGDGFVIGDDQESGEGDGHHNPFIEGAISGLIPSTEYVVAFFRYGLTINGTHDAEQVLLGDPVDDPDALTPLGSGTPAGDPTVAIESFPTIIPFQADANPFVLGNFTTDVNGEGFFDVVIDGSGGELFFGEPDEADFDNSLVGRNDETTFDLPRYNYLVILEGPATDAADAADNPQALRVQMAQDLDAATGDPVNNGNAPYPGGAFTDEQLLAGAGGAGRPDSLTVELLNVDGLGGGAVWKVWLVNDEADPPTVAVGTADYERIAIIREFDEITGEILSETDSVIETVAGTSTFAGGAEQVIDGTPTEIKHRLTITDNTTGGGPDAPGLFTELLLTIESSAAAATPSASRPLFINFRDENGTPTNFFDDSSVGGTWSFGDRGALDGPPSVMAEDDFIQSAGFGGVGIAQLPGGSGVSVDMRNLPLPPPGFYYEGWLVGVGLQTNPVTLSMGPLTTLPPDTVSLFDVDINQDFEGVSSTGIRFANAFMPLGLNEIATADAVTYNTFFLTLSAKLGSAAKPVTDLEIGGLPISAIQSR